MGKKEKKCVYYENVCAKVIFCVMCCICDVYGVILGYLWQLVGLGMEGNIIAHFISSNNIENKLQAENFPKTIGDILNLQNQKGDSRYYKSTISGTKTTLRISDHMY